MNAAGIFARNEETFNGGGGIGATYDAAHQVVGRWHDLDEAPSEIEAAIGAALDHALELAPDLFGAEVAHRDIDAAHRRRAAGQHLAHEAFGERARSHLGKRGGGERAVHINAKRDAGRTLGQFLYQDAAFGRPADAAEGRIETDRQPAKLAELERNLAREAVFAAPGLRLGRDLGLHEARHLSAEFVLLGRELKHCGTQACGVP